MPFLETNLEVLPDGEAAKSFEVLELDLSSREGQFEWLERALDLHSGFFRRLEWPLLEAAREYLQARRAALSRRASKLPNSGVEVELRGRRVLVRNNLKVLRVCFEKGSEVEGIRWLLEELEKDCASSTDGRVRARTSGRKMPECPRGIQKASGSSVADPPDIAESPSSAGNIEQGVREKVLEDLRRHPGVMGATFCQSREALMIRGNFPDNKGRRFFGVPALKRQRKTLEKEDRLPEFIEQTFEGLYKSAAKAALEALEAEALPGGAPGDEGNDNDGASGASDASSATSRATACVYIYIYI